MIQPRLEPSVRPLLAYLSALALADAGVPALSIRRTRRVRRASGSVNAYS